MNDFDDIIDFNNVYNEYCPNYILQNFPFIEDTIDSLTYYELISKCFEYLDTTKADKSEIPDVSNFITKDVNDLTYYYTKSDTNNLLNEKADVSDIPDVSNFIVMESLYHSTGASTGDINLLQNISNYKKIDIVYHSNDSNDDISVRSLINPYNGEKTFLDYLFITGTNVYTKLATIILGTNTITFTNNGEFDINGSFSSGNNIFITDIIGYK